ncbi:MAG: thioredoxin domain-containing protein, partial [Pseudomonadota bacterium]
MMNQLANALSPYLLQHKDNPVHWYEWREEAFLQAKNRNVPILLSIGYASCHWCHVMAHESFADKKTADYLNKHFVCIKVDKEERPDIDAVYMQYLINMTGQGGWPLTIFLMPEKQPFFGGTYFPKQAAHGQIAFLDLLEKIVDLWQNRKQELLQSAAEITEYLNQTPNKTTTASIISLRQIKSSYETLKQFLDFDDGGITGAPKFPQIPLFSSVFLLGTMIQDNDLLQACNTTAIKICQGGIYDHLAGGFARYSTDTQWIVPHFEKMLYDNALIIDWLSTLYAYQPNELFYQRINQTINWLVKEMKLKNGAYASGLDADSEGVEGKFYLWDWQELTEILAGDLNFFADYYGLSAAGNWHGKNILRQNHKNESKIDIKKLDLLKNKLLKQRNKRTRPQRDDKIILDWNALLVSALVKASRVFNQPTWLEYAKKLYDALKAILYKDQQWYHAFRAHKYQQQLFIEDYANVIQACIHLYCATGNTSYLNEAELYLEQANELFLNKDNHIFHQIPTTQKE